MEKILTISIPAYNISSFIDRIMQSLLDSTYKEYLEILIVNDGSKDNTAELAKQYQDKEPTIVHLVDKENGGHGSTINAGIKKATGKFFKVIDGDDWVDTQSLDHLIKHLIEANVTDDIIVCDYMFVDEKGKVIEKVNNLEQNHVNNQFEYQRSYHVEEVCASGTFPFPFHSLYYRTEIMKQIRKIDEKCFYVDIEYALYPFEYAETLRFVDANVYMYLIGREGQSITPENYCKNKANLETVLFSLVDFCNSERLSDAQKAYVTRRMEALYSDIVDVYLYLGEAKAANAWFIPIEQKLRELAPLFYEQMKSNKLLSAIRMAHYHGYKMFSDYKKKK